MSVFLEMITENVVFLIFSYPRFDKIRLKFLSVISEKAEALIYGFSYAVSLLLSH